MHTRNWKIRNIYIKLVLRVKFFREKISSVSSSHGHILRKEWDVTPKGLNKKLILIIYMEFPVIHWQISPLVTKKQQESGSLLLFLIVLIKPISDYLPTKYFLTALKLILEIFIGMFIDYVLSEEPCSVSLLIFKYWKSIK